MICCNCAKPVSGPDEACELGWIPNFWAGDVEYFGPICPECASRHFTPEPDILDGLSLKAGEPVPPHAICR